MAGKVRIFGRQGDQYEVFSLLRGSNMGQEPLGTILELPDGREYCFSINGGVAAAAGNLNQAALPISNHENRSADTARAVGAEVISATVGATAAAQDLYSEGLAHIDVGSGAGQGYAYRIKRAFAKGDAHAAFVGSDAITVNLADGERIKVALVVTTSKVTYTHHRFRNTLIHDSPPTAGLAGVTSYAAAASIPVWQQVKGAAAVLTSGTLVIGDPCVPSATVDGAVMPSAASETDGPYMGFVRHVNATSTWSLIDLKLGS